MPMIRKPFVAVFEKRIFRHAANRGQDAVQWAEGVNVV